MESLYLLFLIVHLVCAIMFLGFVFTDVILLSSLRKNLEEGMVNQIFSIISRRGTKIMPLCVLVLMLSGGAMISQYVGTERGFFENNLQILLVIKVCIALFIFCMIVVSLSCKFLGLKNPLAKIIHPTVLVLGGIVVVLAKLAFYL